MDEAYETWSAKFKRKFKENPWVPLGCLATTGALAMASLRMRHGKSKDMQYWLRARVVLQGVTIVALVGGSLAFQAQRKGQVTNTGLVGDPSTNEISMEQKKEREKAEFETRLKGAEIAHAQEQAFLSSTPSNPPAAESQSTEQSTPPATADSKSKSSWKRWFWGSGDSNKS